MSHEIDLGGLFVSPVLPAAVLAFLVSFLAGRLLDRFGLYRFFWHPSLVEVSLFLIALGLVTILLP